MRLLILIKKLHWIEKVKVHSLGLDCHHATLALKNWKSWCVYLPFDVMPMPT